MDNKISEDDVLAAISSLKAKGLKINIRSVRQEIGSGSFATISPLYKKWRDSQTKSESSRPEMPEPLRKAALQSADALWVMAWDQLADTQSSELSALQLAFQQSEVDQEVLENELWNAQQQHDELHVLLSEAKNNEKELYDKLVVAKEQCAHYAAELKYANEHSQQLQSDLSALKEQHGQQTEHLNAAQQQFKDLNADFDGLQRQMSNMDIQLAEVSSQLILEKDTNQTLLKQLEDTQLQLSQQQEKVQAQNELLESQTSQMTTLNKELTDALQDKKEAKIALRESKNLLLIEQESNRLAQQSIERMWQGQINDLREQLAKLNALNQASTTPEGSV